MRISRMYLNGFGIHRDRTFDMDADAQVTVFYGRNEAGKSTLMGFIRSILFGFPKRNTRIERYEPLLGGLYGGALTVLDHTGQEIRIERYEKNDSLKLLFADGTEAGEPALQILLGGLTAQLYRNLFAFSIAELQEIDSLQADEISGFMLSTSMGISGSALAKAERKISQEMDALYRRQGTKQAINEQLQIIELSETELRRSKEKSGKYQEWQDELSSLDELITKDELELSQIKTNSDWIIKCIKSRDTWMQLLELERELEELPEFINFPENVLGRYEKWFDEHERAKLELLDIQQEQENVDRQRGSISLNHKLIEHKTRLEQFIESGVLYSDSVVRISDSVSELEALKAQLQRYLRQISPDLTIAQLEQFPISIHQQEQVNSLSDRMNDWDHRRQSRANARERLVEQLEHIRSRELELQVRQDEELRRTESRLQQLLHIGRKQLHTHEIEIQQLWERTKQHAADLIHVEDRLEDAMRNELWHQARREQVREHVPLHPNKTIYRILTFLALGILIATSAWMIMELDQVWIGIIMFLVACMGSLAIWLSKPGRSKSGPPSMFDGSLHKDIRAHCEQLEKEASLCHAQWEQLSEKMYASLSHFIEVDSTRSEVAAGYHSDRSTNSDHQAIRYSLQHLGQGMENYLRLMNECIQADKSLQDRELQLRQLASERVELEQRLTSLLSHEDQLQQEHSILIEEWAHWLQLYELPDDISIESMKTMFQYAYNAIQILDQMNRLNHKLTSYQESLDAYELGTKAFLSEHGIDLPLHSTRISYELRKLKEQLDSQSSKQESLRLWDEQLDELRRREQLCIGRMANARDKLNELLAAAKAENEEELRKFVRWNERRITLEQNKRQLQVVIFTWVREEQQPELYAALEQSDADQLAQQLAKLTEDMQLLESRLDSYKDRRGGIRKEMDHLRSGSHHAELLQRHQEHITELQKLASQWAERALGAELMRRAKELYERERQPAVLLKASHYMRTITNGQFVRVVSRLGDKRIFVERENGQQIDSSSLSRGTAEQLYLSMRFALADEYSKTVALPLIMDDIFVNFDADRLARTIAVLSDVAQRHQIILFTCHGHVVDALRSAVPRLQMIMLD